MLQSGSDGAGSLLIPFRAAVSPATGGVTGTGGAVSTGKDPVVPQITQTCPTFANGNINFMNWNMQIVVGTKPSGPTAPMVFYFHGTGSTTSEFAGLAAAVRDGVVQDGGVLVSYDGEANHGDLRSGTSWFGSVDYPIIDQLFACAVRDRNVDPHRVFATGCSAGGLFATALAVERSSYIAAVAPNSGGLIGFPALQFQTPSYTPALMTIHGGTADNVGVSFADTSLRADQTFKNHGGFVINCDHGGNHCAGSGQAPSMWQFFKAHPYGVTPEPYAGGLPAGFSSACTIF